MNILFVNNIPFNPIAGGLERVTDVLAKELIKRGDTIYYLCGKLPFSYISLLNYEYPARLYQFPNYGMFEDKENVRFYDSILKEQEIDIVVNQRGLGGAFNAICPVTNTRLISVIHSKVDADVILFLNEMLNNTAPPLIGVKRMLKKMLPSLFSYLWRRKAIKETKNKYAYLLHYSDAVVTLSRVDVEMFNRFVGSKHQKKVVAIPNPNTFNEIVKPNVKKEKSILYVGRLSKKEKEPLRLLRIWNLLSKKHNDWRLKIVGDGDELENMQNYVKKNRLDNVFFEGKQSDVAKYYEKASIVCLTSNFEGWGMALTEGMQFGCIPFTFNNYGAAYEIIDDGINGCLIPAYDLNKYTFRLSELMSDDEKRYRMSMAAVEKIKYFSVERIADQWKLLFEKIMSSESNS